MNHQALTIVICTHNRPDDLGICLSKLQEQCCPEDEILVVDNRPFDDQTLRMAATFGVNYRRVEQGGKSTAMNIGVRDSKSEIVAFLDDDDFVEEAWRDRILNHFDDPAIAYVSGLRKPFELRTKAQVLFHLKGGFNKGIGLRRFTWDAYKKIWWRGVPIYLVGLGGNSAVRKSAILKVGGFDQIFGPGEAIWASESTEMCYRLLMAGYTLLYDPELTVLNKYIESEYELSQRLFHYGLGDAAIQTKFLVVYGDFRSLSEILFYRSFRQTKRIFETISRVSRFPIRLIFVEWFGNLLGPWIYLVVRAQNYWKQLIG